MPSNSSQITVTPAKMLPDACLFLHNTRSAAKSKGILDAIVIRGCRTPYRLTKVKKTKRTDKLHKQYMVYCVNSCFKRHSVPFFFL